MKRVGILGSVNRDTITQSDGSTRQSLGGVLYTAMAAAYLSGGQYETLLLSQIGVDVYSTVEPLLARCPKIRTEGIRVYSGTNPHCRIHYTQDGQKSERLTGDLKGFTAQDLLPYLAGLDLLVINFITGYELTLQALQDIRQAFTGMIVMDVHSLTLGRRASGERYFRPLTNWRKYVRAVDLVQMNRREAALMGEQDQKDLEAVPPFLKEILGLGCTGGVVTQGENGCWVGTWQHGQPHITEHAAAPVAHVLDATGCGDVFLAGLAAGHLLGTDLSAAVTLATQAAAINCGVTGVEALEQLATIHH